MTHLKDLIPAIYVHHTMLRVENLERSLNFYVDILGMTLLRRQDYPEGRFTLAFLAYPNPTSQASLSSSGPVLELTYNWDHQGSYEKGQAFGHLALSVPDLEKACAFLSQAQVPIPRKPGPMKAGTTPIAFIQDPDGYLIELVDYSS